MSDIRLDVIAIGSLAKNRYWDEKSLKREEYATTTLVRMGKMTLLVDPGWPAEVLKHSLYYRTGLEPGAVTHVFLTHFDAAHRRGIGLFEKAVWWMYDEELNYVEAETEAEAASRDVLARIKAVPEKLAPGLDIFPTFGHTPGHTSLILYTATETTILAGDAVLTRDHFEHADLGDVPWDLAKAKESFRDVMEIADVIVPGHDNVFACRGKGG